MLNLRCIFPSVCAFSLLLFICEIENTTVKIYYRWAGGQESKILLKNNKRWKNMSVNYKTRHVRTVQSSNQASALKNQGDRKLCKWNWHIWIRLACLGVLHPLSICLCGTETCIKIHSRCLSCLKMTSGSIKLPFGNMICWFYGLREKKNTMNSLKGHKISDHEETKADKLGYPKIKNFYSSKM